MPFPSIHPLLWLVDASPSVNHLSEEAIRGTIQLTAEKLSDFMVEHPEVKIVSNVIFFGDQAVQSETDWKPIPSFKSWSMKAQENHGSNLAPALMLANQILQKMSRPPLWRHPLIILVSDGWFTDDESRISAAFRKLLSTENGARSSRISMSIGDTANLIALERFQNDPSTPVLNGDNASAELIKRFYHLVHAT